ncbi:MAG: SpoIIE family protein phosphatase [Candidatus Eisenbacteria bacterium]|nr:SpoIIE family protein phosphatase [Candidatus Eisenbacteria bacterium]
MRVGELVRTPRQVPGRLSGRTVGLWALANTIAGLLIGAGILVFAKGEAINGSIVLMSAVFANVVGFTAVLTVRFVLPRYSGLPAYIRLPLAFATLLGGGVVGSGLALLVNPLIIVYQVRLALMVVTLNGVLALTVGALTYAFDVMRGQIESESTARARLEREMEVARTIQMELLPKKFPSVPGLDLFAFSLPARHVGGDCYDIIELGQGRLAITIGDVAGKGTPAAILMANVQAAVRALSESGVPACQLIEKVNSLVHRTTEDSAFITFFYCVLDTTTGHLRYVNAGHNPPCVLKPDGSKEYLDRGGVVIGIMAGSGYEEGETVLHPGDGLVLYTDGITEAMNPDGDMFGEDRLERVLALHRDASAREIEERVYDDVKRFTSGAAQADDLTMVVVKMVNEPAEDEALSAGRDRQTASGGPSAARGAPANGDLRGSALVELS